MHDVVVVGAGPAGSAVALRLARAGCDVAILERSRFPRHKVCGDYLCTGAIRQLEELGVAGSVLADANPIRAISLHGFGESVCLALPREGAVSLPRELLDARLCHAARSAGATLVRGAFLDAAVEPDGVRVRFRDSLGVERAVSARVLVGADGARSVVAQRCGLAAPQRRRAGRWAVGGRLLGQPGGTQLEMFVSHQGYYARNPLGKGCTNSMLVRASPPRPEDADALVAAISGGQRRFEPEKIERFVAIGPLAYRAAAIIRDQVLLTGDAAELLDPFTGQGVASALTLSAHAAAAARALLDGRPAASVARRYRAEFQRVVAPRRALGALVIRLINVAVLRRRCLRILQRDGSLLRRLVSSCSGIAPPDELLGPRGLWRLLVA
jgi:flavin-dependent dehydrogenase